jgi:hypothetical protein
LRLERKKQKEWGPWKEETRMVGGQGKRHEIRNFGSQKQEGWGPWKEEMRRVVTLDKEAKG